MTYIEKLRELHPDWDDEKIVQYIDIHCPVQVDPMDRIVDRRWRATERERELGAEADTKFYRNYRWRLSARPFPTRVEFDCDEEKMLSEIARYTGYSRDFIAREAVRYMYEEWFLKERRRENGPYHKCHEPIVWMDTDESGESEEVKMDERK